MLKQSQQFSPDSIDPAALKVERQPLKLGASQLFVIRFCHPQHDVLTWPHIASLLVQSPSFRGLWNQTWADLSTDFMWKPVPIHPAFATTYPFFVAIAPSSFRSANSSAYRSHLNRLAPDQRVAVFPNLSGDAQLVVPEATGAYGHIRAFCQLASQPLWDDFWQQVGAITQEFIAQQTAIWCNTHGHGVPWMHVRFDPTHKYAAFPPYGPITESSQQQWYDSIYFPTFGAT